MNSSRNLIIATIFGLFAVVNASVDSAQAIDLPEPMPSIGVMPLNPNQSQIEVSAEQLGDPSCLVDPEVPCTPINVVQLDGEFHFIDPNLITPDIPVEVNIFSPSGLGGVTSVPWETDGLPLVGSMVFLGVGIWGKHKLTRKKD